MTWLIAILVAFAVVCLMVQAFFVGKLHGFNEACELHAKGLL